jgi:hypothetical protein
MSKNIIRLIASLLMELIYRIVNELDPLNILILVRDLCTQLNRVVIYVMSTR